MSRPASCGAWDWGAYPKEDAEMADIQLAHNAAKALKDQFDKPFYGRLLPSARPALRAAQVVCPIRGGQDRAAEQSEERSRRPAEEIFWASTITPSRRPTLRWWAQENNAA